MEVISKTIKIKSDKMPPEIEFIEQSIKNEGIDPVRWAIVKIEDNILTLNVSGTI